MKSLEFHLVISLGKTSSLSEKPSEETRDCVTGWYELLRDPPAPNRAEVLTMGIKELVLGAVLRVPGDVLHAPLRQSLGRHAPCRAMWASVWASDWRATVPQHPTTGPCAPASPPCWDE